MLKEFRPRFRETFAVGPHIEGRAAASTRRWVSLPSIVPATVGYGLAVHDGRFDDLSATVAYGGVVLAALSSFALGSRGRGWLSVAVAIGLAFVLGTAIGIAPAASCATMAGLIVGAVALAAHDLSTYPSRPVREADPTATWHIGGVVTAGGCAFCERVVLRDGRDPAAGFPGGPAIGCAGSSSCGATPCSSGSPAGEGDGR